MLRFTFLVFNLVKKVFMKDELYKNLNVVWNSEILFDKMPKQSYSAFSIYENTILN
jgi:hypothetical protein